MPKEEKRTLKIKEKLTIEVEVSARIVVHAKEELHHLSREALPPSLQKQKNNSLLELVVVR
jgi:hypothetical protein